MRLFECYYLNGSTVETYETYISYEITIWFRECWKKNSNIPCYYFCNNNWFWASELNGMMNHVEIAESEVPKLIRMYRLIH